MSQRRRGRPINPNIDEEIEIDETPMICLNNFGVELMEILSSLSNYQIQIQTGKRRSNQNENDKRDERAKQRKIILKMQKNLIKAENLQNKQFFLLDWEKTPYEFVMMNENLVLQVQRTPEEEEMLNQVNQACYSDLNNYQFYQGFYLVFEQISYETQLFLKAMLETYIKLNSNEKTFENFLQLFQQNYNLNEFPELLQWNKLYKLAYNQKLMVEIEEQEFIVDQFKPKNENINGRIMQKRMEMIKKGQQQIDLQLEFQDQEDCPILYLQNKIFNCIKTHYKEEI